MKLIQIKYKQNKNNEINIRNVLTNNKRSGIISPSKENRKQNK